jgi:hypothetical protein
LVARGVFEIRDYESAWLYDVEFKRYVTTLSRWSEYLAKRTQTCQSAGDVGKTALDAGSGRDEPRLRPKTDALLKAPAKEAVAAHQLYRTGQFRTQEEIAVELSRRFHRPIRQWQVSRWIKLVDAYYQATAIKSPAGTDGIAPKVIYMDPERLDLGSRRDGRSMQQRPARRDDD